MSKYTETESGLAVPSEKLAVGGIFDVFVNGEFVESVPNLVTNEGLDHMLDVALKNGSQNANWYITAFKGNVTPQATWTAANFDTNATEITGTDVSETTREAWTGGAVSGQQVDNYASKAEFTVATATLDLYGLAMLSTSAFGSTAGVLLAATEFSAVRNLLLNDVIGLGYRFSMASS